MKKKQLIGIKFVILFFLIIGFLLINQILNPHTIILGIWQYEGTIATTINALLITLFILSMYFIVKKRKKHYMAIPTITGGLALNSFINIVSSIFLMEDRIGFFNRIYPEKDIFAGFMINQIFLFLFATIITIYLIKNKEVLTKKIL